MPDPDVKLKRREQTFSLLKFILGTFILGAFAQWINYVVQDKKIQLEVRREETKYLETFTNRFLEIETYEAKTEYLTFLKFISQSEEIRERYDLLLQELERRKKEIEQTTKEYESIASNVPDDVKEVLNRLEYETTTGKDFENAQRELSPREISEREQEIRGIVKSNPNLQKMDSVSKQLESAPKMFHIPDRNVSSLSVKRKEEALNLEEEWLKEGYSRDYGTERLAVNRLDVRGNRVVFQLRKKNNDEVLHTFTLGINQSKILPVGNTEYKITLTNIKGAGPNPVTKAAFYQIQKWEN